jgi:hypothetical protein
MIPALPLTSTFWQDASSLWFSFCCATRSSIGSGTTVSFSTDYGTSTYEMASLNLSTYEFRAICPVVLVLIVTLFGACRAERSDEVAIQNLPQLRRPEFYVSEPIALRIVDAETREPVVGAAVVVLWRTVHIFAERWGNVYLYRDLTTDESGRVSIQRWGPLTLDYMYYLDVRDPEIWVLKHGYLPAYFDNTGALDHRVFDSQALSSGIAKRAPGETLRLSPEALYRDGVAGSRWNGEDLMLMKVRSSEQIARALSYVNPVIDFDVPVMRIPQFWNEWMRVYQGLPEPLRRGVRRPRAFEQHLRRNQPDHLEE